MVNGHIRGDVREILTQKHKLFGWQHVICGHAILLQKQNTSGELSTSSLYFFFVEWLVNNLLVMVLLSTIIQKINYAYSLAFPKS